MIAERHAPLRAYTDQIRPTSMKFTSMNIGLMPITGIPLPFMSYGTSFMLVNFMLVGLIWSVYARRGA